MCTRSLAISIVEIYYMGMCLLQETNSSLSLAGTSVETFLSKILPMIWHHMAWTDMAWMQIMRIAEENAKVSSLLRTSCTRTCLVYTIQEVSPCAKTKRMQMKVKMKMKMFGQRFHLWRSFQQAPISFHSMDLIFGSLLASTVPIYFKLRLQYITLPFSEEDRITQHDVTTLILLSSCPSKLSSKPVRVRVR